MTVYRSYSNFTTTRGGVIEGLGGGRKGKIGTIYSKVLKIPDTHIQMYTVDNAINADKCLLSMDSTKLSQLTTELDNGRVIKIRGDIYLKSMRSGKYGVYKNKNIKSHTSKIKKHNKVTPQQRQAQTDEIYRHLLAINQSKNKQ